MKKIISIVCLLSLAICLAGPYPFFAHFQQEIKREMQQYIQEDFSKTNSELIEFKIISGENKTDFDLVDEGKEIRFRGVMYDVVEVKRNDNELIYSCIKDRKETNLLARMKDQLMKNVSDVPVSNETATLIIQIFSQQFLPIESFQISDLTKLMNAQSFIYNEISSLFYPEKISPPPELAA